MKIKVVREGAGGGGGGSLFKLWDKQVRKISSFSILFQQSGSSTPKLYENETMGIG